MKTRLFTTLTTLAMAAAAQVATAQPVEITQPWVRATVAGQKATGAFLHIKAKEAVSLVGASSPVAGVTEVHEMAMDVGVMKMRAISALPLAAGQSAELKPGGHHVMLMDLKAPVEKGSSVPLTLVFQDAKGARTSVQVQAPARDVSARASSGDKAEHKGHAHH